MMEANPTSETSVLTRATRRKITEDGILSRYDKGGGVLSDTPLHTVT
jgi:hypothetical protein